MKRITRRNKIKMGLGFHVFNISNTVFLCILALLTFYPLYYVFIYSLSDPVAAGTGVFFWPRDFTLDNYRAIFEQSEIVRAAFISVSRTLLGTIVTVFGCSLLAYGVTKDILPGNKIISKMTVIAMYFHVGIIPWFLTMRAYGLHNNFFVYIVPTIIVPFYFILLKTYFQSLPSALEESAMVDGAGYFTIFLRVVLPLCKPILATVAIFAGVTQWNSWTDNLFLVTTPRLQTLQLLLYAFLSQRTAQQIMDAVRTGDQIRTIITPMAIRMTITVIVTLPVFLIYPFLQRYFIKGIMIGAVKG